MKTNVKLRLPWKCNNVNSLKLHFLMCIRLNCLIVLIDFVLNLNLKIKYTIKVFEKSILYIYWSSWGWRESTSTFPFALASWILVSFTSFPYCIAKWEDAIAMRNRSLSSSSKPPKRAMIMISLQTWKLISSNATISSGGHNFISNFHQTYYLCFS